MSWTVIARLVRDDGSTMTRYTRTYKNKHQVEAHFNIIDGTWADPRVEIVLEEGGPFRLIETKGDNDE